MLQEEQRRDGEKEKTRIDLDTILTEEVGQFGKYQMRTAVLSAIVTIFVSWTFGEYIFTTGRLNTRCLIPECESDASTAEYAPSWILNAIPGDSIESFDNCQRYANTTTANSDVGTCPISLFDRYNVMECEEYVYENTNTVVYDFNLACDEWSRTLIGTIRTIGTMPAFPLAGFMSDRWGRKTAMLIDAFNMVWLGTIRYTANSYVGFIVMQFVETVFSASCHSCAYILITEISGPKYRVMAGALMYTSFSIGKIILGLMAWTIPHWKNLTLAIFLPQVVLISYYWIYPESVRWYLSKGKFEESEALLKKMAQVNGTKLSEKSLEALKSTAEEEQRRKEKEAQAGVDEPWLVLEVFRHKKILLRCVTSPVWWITGTMIYYGLNINSVNILGGNQYFNYITVAAAEIPGYWAAVILLGRIGRRAVLTGGFWICAACLIAFVFIPSDLYALALVVYLIGTLCIATVFISIYVYTAELYPTPYRHRLFAFSSMLGRIGNITAPLTPAIGAATFEGLPFILFAALALISGFLILLLPETLGTKLPETMEEASNIGTNKNKETYL